MYDLWFNKFHVFSKTNLYPSYKSQSILIEKIELSKFLKKGGIVSLKSPLTRIILSKPNKSIFFFKISNFESEKFDEKAVSDFHPLYKSADCYVAGKVNYLGYTSELKYDTQKQIKDSQSHENLLYVFNGFSESYHLTAQTGYYTAFFEVFSVSKDVLDACGEKNVLKLKKYPENIACLETLDNKVLYEGLTLIKTICVEA